MTDLLPCPFCGSAAKVSHLDFNNKTSDARMIRCSSTENDCSTLEEHTVEVWNTRPIEDRLRRELDDVEKMRCPICDYPAPENEKDWPNSECVVCTQSDELCRLRRELDEAREAIRRASRIELSPDIEGWYELPAVRAAMEEGEP